MLELSTKIATVISGLGTFLTVLWAVFLYWRNRADMEADRFRSDIVGLLNRYEEMMVLFQNNIVNTTKAMFNQNNPETQFVLKKTLECLNEPDLAVAKAKFETYERQVNEWVLYSLDNEMLGASEKPRLECYAHLQSIRGFLPVLFAFVDKVGSVIFSIYKHELSANSVREYVIGGFEHMWNIKKSASVAIDNEYELIVVWRNIISRSMNALSSKVDFADVFNDTIQIIDAYAELYLRQSNHELWKSHLSELKADTQSFRADTKTETLVKIVKWKIGKSDPDLLAKLVAHITNLEDKLTPNK